MPAEDTTDPDTTPSRRSLVANLLYAVAAILVAYVTTVISGLANDVATLATELERFCVKMVASYQIQWIVYREQLDWEVYDRDLINRVATTCGVQLTQL